MDFDVEKKNELKCRTKEREREREEERFLCCVYMLLFWATR